MSVEAISWALNLAPVPFDRGSKPNPACKAVLVGLANHAAADGTEAFPSVRTLIRCTCLSKPTLQTALDRLKTDGIIRPRDPAIVAAKIKRAGFSAAMVFGVFFVMGMILVLPGWTAATSGWCRDRAERRGRSWLLLAPPTSSR